jgi:AAA domain/UvrD-like helicase C-terminal domain/Nuclease-related domain
MRAGASAGDESRRQQLLAEAHDRAAAAARGLSQRMAIAERTEAQTARALAPLAALGHVLLADRRWPGTKSKNVDLVVVGPGGLLIVDTKCWADVSIADGRIKRGQADVTDDLDGLLRLVEIAQDELAEVGLAPLEVVPLVVLSGRRGINERLGRIEVVGDQDVLAHIVRRGQRLTEGQLDAVLARTLSVFPSMNAPVNEIAAVVPEPVLPAPRAATDDDLALLSEDSVREATVQAALAQPIEEWMTFLHPEQAKLVRRTLNGPARIRGAAGTGKTVVGLHRAAYLAETRPGRILYTSFVKTLPVVLRELYRRLSPQTVDRLEFVHVHKVAKDFLEERGLASSIDLRASECAYRAAWAEVGKVGGLKNVPQQWDYWQEEIQYVIKGRGLTQFRQYVALDRVGRRYPLNPDQRRLVWDLYCAYEKHLSMTGKLDMADVFLRAEEELRRRPLDLPYTAIVVDEVQDLSCAMVRMLHLMVGDRPDGLLLIGDGQQSVYPGGFTLREAGVSVSGRASVLRVNYRNTAEILEMAQDVVSHDAFSDLDGLEELGQRDVEVVRHGLLPIRYSAREVPAHDAALVSALLAATSRVSVCLGDVAVLAAHHRTVKHYLEMLRHEGIPAVPLEQYDGRPTNAVKVGTFKRAKGLEFKFVFLPQLADGPGTRWTDESDAAYRERVELERRELFVGMTRARDGLWLGFLIEQ